MPATNFLAWLTFVFLAEYLSDSQHFSTKDPHYPKFLLRAYELMSWDVLDVSTSVYSATGAGVSLLLAFKVHTKPTPAQFN
jgi:hypothetical protein